MSLCKSCVRGKYAEGTINTLQDNCLSCPAGKANTIMASKLQSECATCPQDTYSGSAAGVCESCHNTQNSGAGSIQRSDCKCNSGYTGPDGALSCTMCTAGQYKKDNNPGICTPCPENTYNSIAALSGIASCRSCPLLSSTTGIGKDSIDDCKCDEGTYTTGPEQEWICNTCNPGKYSDQPHSVQCTNCPVNTYQDSFGKTDVDDCQSCPANSNAVTGSGSSQACMCNKGYSGEAGTTCTICAKGKYSASENENNAFCTQCGDGKITVSPGTTTAGGCAMCGSGKYASADHKECLTCPQNTYCVNGMQLQCEDFRANTYNLISGSSNSNACVCVAATYLKNGACYTCIANFFCTGVDNAISQCPANSESVTSSVTIDACECSPGYDGENGKQCSPCGVGTYKTSKGNLGCTACGTGMYSGDTARTKQTACNQCPKGTASNILTAGSCPLCIKGKFSDTLGALVCTNCGVGQWSDSVGATANSCQWCKSGTFQKTTGAQSEASCLLCPVGKTKPWPLTIETKPFDGEEPPNAQF